MYSEYESTGKATSISEVELKLGRRRCSLLVPRKRRKLFR